LVPYLILLAAGLIAIEGTVHRWHERRISQAGGQHVNNAWKVLPVFLASVYGGYFGGGLSVIVLAVLALVSNETLTRLNALKQVIALCVNVAAAILFLFSGKVIWSATMVMAVAALAGGAIGGLAADRVRPSVLRGIVCGVRGDHLHSIFRSIGNFPALVPLNRLIVYLPVRGQRQCRLEIPQCSGPLFR